MFNLHKALTAGFGPADFVGMIPMRSDPTGMAASPDGRYLYVRGGLAGRHAVQIRHQAMLAIVDMRKAETNPGSSVVRVGNALRMSTMASVPMPDWSAVRRARWPPR